MKNQYTGRIITAGENGKIIAEVFENKPEDAFFMDLDIKHFSTSPREGDIIELLTYTSDADTVKGDDTKSGSGSHFDARVKILKEIELEEETL